MRRRALRNAACSVAIVGMCCFFTFAAHAQLSAPPGVAAEDGGALVPPMFQAPLPCANAGELKVLGELRGYWNDAYNQANVAWSEVHLEQKDYDAAWGRFAHAKGPGDESPYDIRTIQRYGELASHYQAALIAVRRARTNYDNYLDTLEAKKCPGPQLPPPSTVPAKKTEPSEPATMPGPKPAPSASPKSATPKKI